VSSVELLEREIMSVRVLSADAFVEPSMQLSDRPRVVSFAAARIQRATTSADP